MHNAAVEAPCGFCQLTLHRVLKSHLDRESKSQRRYSSKIVMAVSNYHIAQYVLLRALLSCSACLLRTGIDSTMATSIGPSYLKQDILVTPSLLHHAPQLPQSQARKQPIIHDHKPQTAVMIPLHFLPRTGASLPSTPPPRTCPSLYNFASSSYPSSHLPPISLSHTTASKVTTPSTTFLPSGISRTSRPSRPKSSRAGSASLTCPRRLTRHPGVHGRLCVLGCSRCGIASRMRDRRRI